VTTTDDPDAPNALDTLVRKAATAADPRRPVLIWITNSARRKEETSTVRKILSDEKTICALQRFVCLKGDISLIPDESGRKEALEKAPIFYFFDPAATLVDSLRNKRALSRPLFAARLKKVWGLTYAMPLKTYIGKRAKILDALGAVTALDRELHARIEAAGENTRLLAALQQEEKRLLAEVKRLEAEEWRLIEGADLREKFFDAAPESAVRESEGSGGSIRTGTRR
jgi:hypothetical protein